MRTAFSRASFLVLFALATSLAAGKTFPIAGLETVWEEPVPLDVGWNEEWFGRKSSFEYDHDIARIAAVLSEVAYDDYSAGKPHIIEDIYAMLGVDSSDIEMHYDIDYGEPILGNDQAAFSIASRTIKTDDGEFPLVFVTIRGTPLNANEWISNLNISDKSKKPIPTHEGFSVTAEQVHHALMTFLLKKGIPAKDAFFLITGHSRGAAIANLLGARMAADGIFDTARVYDFTFASPNVTTDENCGDEKFGFIWNIINAEDIVPTVPPNRNGWKYRKFGRMRALVNAWNTKKERYEDEFLPRMNEIYRRFLGRDFSPFRTGPFIPAQVSRVLTSLYDDVPEYYAPILGLRKKAESIFLKVFPEDEAEIGDEEDFPADETETDTSPEDIGASGGSSFLMAAIAEMINDETDGLINYTTDALVDMHACESYLAWMVALDGSEAFSEMGSSQISLGRHYDAAVFDENGERLALIKDGLVQFKSIRNPVAAFSFFNKTVIGFPANEDFTVVVYNAGLIPAIIPTEIEKYDACGVHTETCPRTKLHPSRFRAYEFGAGAVTVAQETVAAETLSGNEMRKTVRRAKIYPQRTPLIQPEITVNADAAFGFGILAGCHDIYALATTSQSPLTMNKCAELAPGIGHQECIFGSIYFGTDALARLFWRTGGDGKHGFVAAVPSVRLSLSYKPYRRFQFFAAAGFDFRIDGKNDDAFENCRRECDLGQHRIGSTRVSVAPNFRLGIRF